MKDYLLLNPTFTLPGEDPSDFIALLGGVRFTETRKTRPTVLLEQQECCRHQESDDRR
jgi:hypothetical protein